MVGAWVDEEEKIEKKERVAAGFALGLGLEVIMVYIGED